MIFQPIREELFFALFKKCVPPLVDNLTLLVAHKAVFSISCAAAVAMPTTNRVANADF